MLEKPTLNDEVTLDYLPEAAPEANLKENLEVGEGGGREGGGRRAGGARDENGGGSK